MERFAKRKCRLQTGKNLVELKIILKKAINVLSIYKNLVTKFQTLKGWKADRAQSLLNELSSN